GDLELTPERALIQRLDVLQLVNVAQPFRVDLALRERVEHEGIVGVWAMRDVNGAGQLTRGSSSGGVRIARAARRGGCRCRSRAAGTRVAASRVRRGPPPGSGR